MSKLILSDLFFVFIVGIDPAVRKGWTLNVCAYRWDCSANVYRTKQLPLLKLLLQLHQLLHSISGFEIKIPVFFSRLTAEKFHAPKLGFGTTFCSLLIVIFFLVACLSWRGSLKCCSCKIFRTSTPVYLPGLFILTKKRCRCGGSVG